MSAAYAEAMAIPESVTATSSASVILATVLPIALLGMVVATIIVIVLVCVNRSARKGGPASMQTPVTPAWMATPSKPAAPAATSAMDTLESLHSLYEQGVLTEEEYRQKKQELLSKI